MIRNNSIIIIKINEIPSGGLGAPIQKDENKKIRKLQTKSKTDQIKPKSRKIDVRKNT